MSLVFGGGFLSPDQPAWEMLSGSQKADIELERQRWQAEVDANTHVWEQDQRTGMIMAAMSGTGRTHLEVLVDVAHKMDSVDRKAAQGKHVADCGCDDCSWKLQGVEPRPLPPRVDMAQVVAAEKAFLEQPASVEGLAYVQQDVDVLDKKVGKIGYVVGQLLDKFRL